MIPRLERHPGIVSITLGGWEVKARKLQPGARLANGFPHIGRWNVAFGRTAESEWARIRREQQGGR